MSVCSPARLLAGYVHTPQTTTDASSAQEAMGKYTIEKVRFTPQQLATNLAPFQNLKLTSASGYCYAHQEDSMPTTRRILPCD